MGDYIKELTTIDFLGILVPGSFLLLLFSLDYPVWDIWRFYFEEGSVADTVIFLIAGYLIGMLLHELGDLFEKLIWVCPWFNPRYHAAKTVFVATGVTLPFQFPARDIPASKSKTQFAHISRQYVLPGIGSFVLLASLFIFPLLFQSGNIELICAYFLIGAVALLPILCGIKAKQSIDHEKAMEYVAQNAYIQTVIYGKASAAKRQMFDGFYCMMRNLLLVMGISNTYAFFCTELHMPPPKCNLTADDGASPPPEWCTPSAKMVHGGRERGAPDRHAGDHSGMPLRFRMDSPSIWMV